MTQNLAKLKHYLQTHKNKLYLTINVKASFFLPRASMNFDINPLFQNKYLKGIINYKYLMKYNFSF